MTTPIRTALVGAFVLLSVHAHAQVSQASPAKTLTALLSQYHTVTAHFTQTVINGRGHVLQRASGQFAAKRPHAFRWQIQTPTQQLWVTRGRYLWIYDRALQQVVRQKIKPGQYAGPGILLGGYPEAIDRHFNVQLLREKGKARWFTLRPKTASLQWRWMTLRFEGRRLLAMAMMDGLGRRMDIHFFQLKINPKLKQNLFKYHPPKGMDLVDY